MLSNSCRMQHRSFHPFRPSTDFICSGDFYCFFFFSQILKLDMPQTSFNTLLPFCFHSTWNTFHTSFWGGVGFFPQILSLHLSLHIGKNESTQSQLLSSDLSSCKASSLKIGTGNPWPNKASCALLSPYNFLRFQARAVTSSGDSFSVKEEEK